MFIDTVTEAMAMRNTVAVLVTLYNKGRKNVGSY